MVVNAKDVTDSVDLSDPYPLMPTHSCPRLNFHTFLYLSLNLNQAPLCDSIKTEFNIPCHSLFTAVLVSGKRPISLNPLQFEIVDGEEIVEVKRGLEITSIVQKYQIFACSLY